MEGQRGGGGQKKTVMESEREERERRGEGRERSSSFLAALQASHPRTVNLLFEILFNIDYWQARCMQSLRKGSEDEISKDLYFVQPASLDITKLLLTSI